MKRHSLLFALFIFLSSLSMQAEETAGKWSERYNVTAITMDEGLPHNFVDDILKDSQGFLWIATRGEGIARYDGYEFTAFNMGSTHTKLRSNFINKLCEDNFKRIWLANYPTGITIRNNRYGRYDLIKHSLGTNRSLVNDQVHDVIERCV